MRTLALSLVVLSLIVVPARAATMYDYTGNQFTSWTGDTCLGDCDIAISFVLATTLPANSTFTGVNSFFNAFGSSQFMITDGQRVFREGEGGVVHVDDQYRIFATDGAGLPSRWVISFEVFRSDGSTDNFTSTNCPGGCEFGSGVSDFTSHLCCGLTLSTVYSASNENNVGTWHAIAVPEPMSLLLLVTGVVGLASMRPRSWKRSRKAAVRRGEHTARHEPQPPLAGGGRSHCASRRQRFSPAMT
jgi:hypothetical protein